RESILNPQAKVVADYQPIMPSFQGVVSQDQVNALIAYIRTLPVSTNVQAGAVAPATGQVPIPATADGSTTAPEASTPNVPADNTAAPAASTPEASASSTTDTSNAATTAGESSPAPAADDQTTTGEQQGVQ